MKCAFCGSHAHEVMSFGNMALAGGFLKPEAFKSEQKYPLSLEFCESCYALQVPQRVPTDTLFSEYFYFSSATHTMRRHFIQYAAEIVERFQPKHVVEIGCNDGVLLNPLAMLGVEKLTGVDPARNVLESITDPRITKIPEFFRAGMVPGKTDVVVANNVFAHMPDINGVTAAIADLLTDDGVFIFEVNRLDSMIADLQYDWVYHEHFFYYSALALEKHLARHGLEIFDLKRLGTHAGSIRYYAGKRGLRRQSQMVSKQFDTDRWHGLDRIDTFQHFGSRAHAHAIELRELVERQTGEVAGYGACGRTNTLLQFAGLDHRHISYIIDDAPAKQGFYTPGTHIPIVAREKQSPDLMVVFAWSFLREIEPKIKGISNVLIPLPSMYYQQKQAA